MSNTNTDTSDRLRAVMDDGEQEHDDDRGERWRPVLARACREGQRVLVDSWWKGKLCCSVGYVVGLAPSTCVVERGPHGVRLTLATIRAVTLLPEPSTPGEQ